MLGVNWWLWEQWPNTRECAHSDYQYQDSKKPGNGIIGLKTVDSATDF